MHNLDASFRLKKQAALASRRRSRLRRAFAAASGVLILLASLAAYYFTRDQFSVGDQEAELQFAEDAEIAPPPDAAVYVPSIVDLAGDPMWISLARQEGDQQQVRSIPKPAKLTDPGISPQIEVLADAMLSSSEHFMTTIPSTQEDFAYFEAQRTAWAMPSTNTTSRLQPVTLQSGQAEAFADPAAGWGETVGAGEAALPEFAETEIENNISVATVIPEADRVRTTEDMFVRVVTEGSLESVILEERFSPEDAKLAGEALKAVFARDSLEPGYVVALRGHRGGRGTSALSLMQVSIYAKDTFIGTLARNAAGRFVSSADPWVRDDLFNYSGRPRDDTIKRQYRLLDAIYSTAARNNVPSAVIGEAIMYLSRGQDLNAFATQSDRLVLVYSGSARGSEGIGGRVLYAGVRGGERSLDCFVFRQANGEYACVSGNDQVRSLAIINGMAMPVQGVLTSPFGPRKHPILNVVRIHKGVDWVAPVGTPVLAAFDGEILFRGDGGGYGNVVRLSHAGGRETRYAHLQRFAEDKSVGASVKAGEVIGYVGSTGQSTGPHLHFELHQGNEAIDPLGTVTVAARDGSAVETLTDRIIRVESAGNPRAKNPLSSATGLGQFITSTWLRMMHTYRPDLARTLSREQLLALRFDPTISREMVRNLAREGEAYLRARGHQITAGRLYLCHFLGMDGAHQVLSAPAHMALIDLMGPGVIKANPFLTGKDVSYVINWAERKMRGRGAPAAAPAPSTVTAHVTETSPEFEQYKAAITELLASTEHSL